VSVVRQNVKVQKFTFSFLMISDYFHKNWKFHDKIFCFFHFNVCLKEHKICHDHSFVLDTSQKWMHHWLFNQYNECFKITRKKRMKNNWILNCFLRHWSLERFVFRLNYIKRIQILFRISNKSTPMALEWKKMFQKIKNYKRTLFIFLNLLFPQINMFHFAITIYTSARITGRNINLNLMLRRPARPSFYEEKLPCFLTFNQTFFF